MPKTPEQTASFILPGDLLNRLAEMSESTGESKDALISQALESYLEDLEDVADAEAILDRVYSGEEELISADELVKSLGLDI